MISQEHAEKEKTSLDESYEFSCVQIINDDTSDHEHDSDYGTPLESAEKRVKYQYTQVLDDSNDDLPGTHTR